MVTALYASLAALWIYYLALKVIKVRRKERIAYGDQKIDALIKARSAHSNAVENSLIILLLLFALEFNGAPIILIHIVGVLFLIGRVFHAQAMLEFNLKKRTFSMVLTLLVALFLVVANLIYLPYEKLFSF